MAFIVQCPHPDCRKFMMLEDHVRGTQVECLICERTISLEPAASEGPRSKPPPLKQSSAGASPRAERQEIAKCPNCRMPLRLPPTHEGKAIRCPACKHVFTP
jgi:hypothetical protein